MNKASTKYINKEGTFIEGFQCRGTYSDSDLLKLLLFGFLHRDGERGETGRDRK